MEPVINIELAQLKDISNLSYESGYYDSPLLKMLDIKDSKKKIIFADDTASGRGCIEVDRYIEREIYPYYSNTHSNAYCGTKMKEGIENTRHIIRKYMHLNENQKIIFSGNGCTGAINHLVNKIDFIKYKKIVIHSTPFEHHSNLLPWQEKMKSLKNLGCMKNKIIEHNFIQSNDNFDLLLESYIQNVELSLLSENILPHERLDLFCLITCSNVTGKRYDLIYPKLWEYINKKKAIGHKMYLILDYACSAPYVDINASLCDALCFSGHKFLGGQCTPGILIVNQDMLNIEHPYEPGGGCVIKADDKCVIYKPETENREMGGTPNIIGILRLGKVLDIKNEQMKIIKHNEHCLSKIVTQYFKDLHKIYPTFQVVGIDSRTDDDLPIFPITIKDLHYNFITVLLNDLFGIQTRGGISCCGVLGRICKDLYDIDGWCRISFSYLFTKDIVIYILDAIKHVVIYGHKYKDLYYYDQTTNLFHLKKLIKSQ